MNLSIFSVEQQRLALVVGQTDYQFLDKLPSAVLDAQLINRTLKNISFTTTVLTNKTNEELNIQLKEFSRKLKNGDIVFVYYSGHAMQQTIKNKADNHLFGIDAKSEIVDGVKNIQGVALLGKIFYKYFLENCIYLVVVDACRKYPKCDEKIKTVFTNDRGEMTLTMDCLAEDIMYRQIDFVYACQPGYGVNEPEEGEVGYLAKALSIALSKPGTWTEALVQTIKQVQKDTNNIQKPAISLNVGQQILIKPLGLLLRQVPQKIQPQINQENLQISNLYKFEQSLRKGVATNQFIVIQKDLNHDGSRRHLYVDLRRTGITLIKGVKILSDFAYTKHTGIWFGLHADTTLQIEDCVFGGVGLTITTTLKPYASRKEYFQGKKAIVNRVKISNAPIDGLSVKCIKSVQIENVILQNCWGAGFKSDGVADLNIQKCYTSDCGTGLSIYDTNFYARNIDVRDTEYEAFKFRRSKGVLKDCGFGECSIGISEDDSDRSYVESQIKYENIQLLDEQ